MAKGLSLKTDLVGFKELEAKLKKLGPKIAKKVLRQAVSKAGTLMKKEMKAATPVDTGELKASIFKKVRKSSEGRLGGFQVDVGSSLDKKFVGTIEFGSRHKGGRPFMRRSLDRSRRRAVKILEDALKEGIAKETR